MTVSKYENATSFLLPRIIDGGLGGVLGVTFIYPIDLAKTRLQNQRSLHSPGSYDGLFDCVRKTYKKEGFLKMYKGYPLAASMMAPEKAIKMAVNDFFRRMAASMYPEKLLLEVWLESAKAPFPHLWS